MTNLIVVHAVLAVGCIIVFSAITSLVKDEIS